MISTDGWLDGPDMDTVEIYLDELGRGDDLTKARDAFKAALELCRAK